MCFWCTFDCRQQHNIPLNSWEQKWAFEQGVHLYHNNNKLTNFIVAYKSSSDDNVTHDVVEMSDTHKGHEPYVAPSDTVMFVPSHPSEPKQSEKPRRRTFEEIRAENRKHRDPLHLPHNDNTGD